MIHESSCLYVCLSVCLSVLSVCLSVGRSVCVFVCVFVCLFVCLCVCLFVCFVLFCFVLFVCLFVIFCLEIHALAPHCALHDGTDPTVAANMTAGSRHHTERVPETPDCLTVELSTVSSAGEISRNCIL